MNSSRNRPAPRGAGLAVAVGWLLVACGVSIPTDPDGTLDRVRQDRVLRVGASPSPGWVDLGPDQVPTGREPQLVQEFAKHLGAEVSWTVAGEERLVGLLEGGVVDLVVGGVTDQNPWVEKAGLTRPYAEESTPEGTQSHVMMVPMGENAFQSELERWLDEVPSP